jgi:hypothetical protein
MDRPTPGARTGAHRPQRQWRRPAEARGDHRRQAGADAADADHLPPAAPADPQRRLEVALRIERIEGVALRLLQGERFGGPLRSPRLDGGERRQRRLRQVVPIAFVKSPRHDRAQHPAMAISSAIDAATFDDARSTSPAAWKSGVGEALHQLAGGDERTHELGVTAPARFLARGKCQHRLDRGERRGGSLAPDGVAVDEHQVWRRCR